MKVAIMQPYFFPYIGYFQLMNAVDEFVIYDNIEFTRKGWINRNRILVNNKDEYITLPLRKGSDYLHVKERYLADSWPDERKKILNKLLESYRKAPCFNEAFPYIKEIVENDEKNLFNFLLSAILAVKNYLGITTPLVVSSTIPIDHTLRSTDKVLALCKARNASVYINPIGGVELYSKETFRQNGIELQFLKADECCYEQYTKDFIPFLSIIDVMMFNSREAIGKFLNQYTIH